MFCFETGSSAPDPLAATSQVLGSLVGATTSALLFFPFLLCVVTSDFWKLLVYAVLCLPGTAVLNLLIFCGECVKNVGL